MPTMMQVTLRTEDAIPENFIVNQFCVDTMETGDGATVAATAAVKAFYDDINGPILAETISQTGHIVKFYQLPGVKPNYPYIEHTFDLQINPTGGVFASEVALCLSFQGDRTPGFPQARRRGRVYLGPIRDDIADQGRPDAASMATIAQAASDFGAAIKNVLPGYRWAVWSVTDQQAVFITDGWIDDSWDTQRSRGYARTFRELWTVA